MDQTIKELRNKVVLITGASSGIGAACAINFALEGSLLSITGRNLESLTKIKEKCLSHGLSDEKVLVTQAELDKDDEIKKVVDETVSKFGRIDVLINSAGILIAGSMESSTMEDYDKIMNVNLRSPYLLSKLVLPHLIASKGNIVNISSITGPRAFPGVMSYCLSKAAMDQMTRCLALEVADRGVRVNAVNPGVIKTEVHKRGGMNDTAYTKFLEHSKTTHAMGRVGEVEEVSRTVVFLASSHASFITGTTIPIDGGRGVMCPR